MKTATVKANQVHPNFPLIPLGDYLGYLSHLPACNICGHQFTSRRDLIAMMDSQSVCERCATDPELFDSEAK